MSENTKPPSENDPGQITLVAETVPNADNNPLPDVEAQMRRALGLYGGMRPRMDNERTEQPVRMMDRFGPQGGNQGLHRRRFVQDGEIPVTVVRRDPLADNAPAPQSSRLQRTEAALAAETAARERAERALHDAQAQIATLQTKIGHADLARAEAVDIARRERDAAATLREFSYSFNEQIHLLKEQLETADNARRTLQAAVSDERAARKSAERALRDANDRADRAEAALSLLEQEQEEAAQPEVETRRETWTRPVVARAPEIVTPPRRGRPPGSKAAPKPVVTTEAEPVKWWLMPSSKAKGR